MPKISGRNRAVSGLRRLPIDAVSEVSQSLFAGGERIKATASRKITEGSAGGSSGGKHQHIPSRPGEPPNEFTGHLRSQLAVTQEGPLHVRISSNAKYSAPLEFGSSKMAARPFLGPSAREEKKAVTDLVSRAVDRAIRKAKK